MKRLTKFEDGFYQHTFTGKEIQFTVYELCKKLGKLEDLMEKYEIESVEELEKDLERLEALEKAIEILKETLHLSIDFYDDDYDYEFIIKVAGLFKRISSEEYELLEGVLE